MMKKLTAFFTKLEQQLIDAKWMGNPVYEVVRFTVIYLFVGLLWITTSDDFLVMMVTDIELLMDLQTVKGWFYVFTSAALFASILIVRLKRNQALHERILYQQNHDELTQLPNRNRLADILAKRIQKDPNRSFALISLNIDDFATINELLGYAVGDALLIDLTKSLTQSLHTGDTLSRSGTGFILTYALCERTQSQFDHYLNDLLHLVNQERIIEDQSLFITASIGVSVYPKDGKNFNELYKAADTAMHHLKGNIKNSYNYYKEAYHRQRMDRIHMVNALRKAFDKHEVYMLYQPIVNLFDEQIIAYEALMRWDSQLFGLVSPDVFIRVAEQTNLIRRLEEFVFETCFKQILEHQKHDILLHLSINLSSKGLVDVEFMHTIERLLLTYPIAAAQVQIEITETAVIENFDLAKRNLLHLKQLGFILALDDFGTGFSSLTYLHQLPMDVIKIDRSFLFANGQSFQHEILGAMIDLGHKLKLKIIPEGIETVEQKQCLVALGCVYGQGYLFGSPRPLALPTSKD